jgi:hypothetical protein
MLQTHRAAVFVQRCGVDRALNQRGDVGVFANALDVDRHAAREQ